jgi:hypothetical protein
MAASTTWNSPQPARELQSVADRAPVGQWCWATQAAEALTAMQRLVADAMAQHRDAVESGALAAQALAYRSAAPIGISQTAARPRKLLKKHNSLAHRPHRLNATAPSSAAANASSPCPAGCCPTWAAPAGRGICAGCPPPGGG